MAATLHNLWRECQLLRFDGPQGAVMEYSRMGGVDSILDCLFSWNGAGSNELKSCMIDESLISIKIMPSTFL